MIKALLLESVIRDRGVERRWGLMTVAIREGFIKHQDYNIDCVEFC